MKYIHDKLGSPHVKERLLWSIFIFFVLFFSVVVLSYYVLPQEFLKGKHPLQNWETSKNIFVCSMQIFWFNSISAIVMVAANLFSQKRSCHRNYVAVGYVAFFVLVCFNAVVLGTWSFSVESTPVPLWGRILRTFDLIHRAGLWEMMGQLLIVSATTPIGIVLTNEKETTTRSIRSVHLTKAELCVLISGILFMLAGAVIESIAINAVS